jgi:asparagine synthase (glutamine-hydrolysing)
MCCIAGTVRRIPGSPEPAPRPRSEKIAGIVARISDAQRHQGPDGSGLWQSSGHEVVFGHRRLAILDLSEAGAQPMVDGDSECAVSFNGEIYNFLEIRHDLEHLGERFRSSCDTEVILKAHKRWGIEAVRCFPGIFALALWDPRARAVHLVRDPMGIKPLYWTIVREDDTGEEVVLFPSEVRALLASGAVPQRVEPAAIASYLWHGFVVGPDSILQGVHLLPAASILTIEAEDDTRGKTRSRCERTGTCRRRRTAEQPWPIFAVCSRIRSRHTNLVLTERSFLEQLPDAFTAIDQPTFDGINTYFVSRAARNAGITVALAGTGGDELFGGYASYVDIPGAMRAGGWLPFGDRRGVVRRTFDHAVTLGARVANELAWNVLKVAPPQTRRGKIADLARAAHDPLGLYQVSYALFTRETQAALAADVVRRAQQQQQYGLPGHVAAAWRQRIEGSELLHAISVLELSSFIGERLLRDTDAASMAVALEVRVPLIDHVLAETVAGIDPACRFLPARKKQLLRDVALARLDAAIFERPKSGFVLPIDTWARRRLQPRMEALFADSELPRRVGLRGEAVQTLWRSFLDGRPGLYWSRVWAIYVLLSWCQTHDMSILG